MRRNVILSALVSMCALVFVSSSAPAKMLVDPLNCTGYPEPRLFLENQSWWEPQAPDPARPGHPGVGKQGHIHVGTCFPLYQRLSGNTLHLDINLKLHNMTSTAFYLRIDAEGDFGYEVPRPSWTGDANKAWRCDVADCERWVSVDVPLSGARYRGDHQWNIFLIAWIPSTRSQKQYNLTRWHATIDKPLPDAPAGSLVAKTRQTAWFGPGGDTWTIPFSGGKYARVGMSRSDIPWNEITGQLKPLAGIWRPRINFEKEKNFVFIDPYLHAVPPHKGTVVWETAPTNTIHTKQFAIDTRKLANGLHRLVFGTGNVSSDGTHTGTHTGVGVIPFLVRN